MRSTSTGAGWILGSPPRANSRISSVRSTIFSASPRITFTTSRESDESLPGWMRSSHPLTRPAMLRMSWTIVPASEPIAAMRSRRRISCSRTAASIAAPA